MSTSDFDLVISGAGPVGCTLALLLARISSRPQRIALLGRNLAPNDTVSAPKNLAHDPRTLAMNHGSRALLEQLDAWPGQSASITTVHVSQRGRMGRTLITHKELGVPRLGSVVAYQALQQVLLDKVSQSGISLIQAGRHSVARTAYLAAADGSAVTGRVIVKSDGTPADAMQRQYDQRAVLTLIHADQAQLGRAFERFTDQGPLAILPHPAGPNHYAVVWCCRPERAQRLMQLDAPRFEQELQAMFGFRLGRLSLAGERHDFALAFSAGPHLINHHTLAIGNAAQTLHPVAGQGLNLGLRDASQLAQTLGGWLHSPEQDPAALLRQFARKRQPDRWITSAVTDILPRIFATGIPLVDHACGISLLALDLSHSLRAPLTRHLLQGLRS